MECTDVLISLSSNVLTLLLNTFSSVLYTKENSNHFMGNFCLLLFKKYKYHTCEYTRCSQLWVHPKNCFISFW